MGNQNLSFSLLIILIFAKNISAYERVVEDVSGALNGAPIDFRYNESVTERGGLPSVPGCPKSDNGIPWVYYGSPPKCYLSGTSYPCEGNGDFNSKLFLQHGSPYGVCGCACLDSLNPSVKFSLDKMYACSKPDFGGVEVKYIFLPRYGKCFQLDAQNFGEGPCKSDEWLVAEENQKSLASNSEIEVNCLKECPKERNPHSCYPRGGGAGAVDILPNDCPEDMKYSKVLKECVKKPEIRFQSAIG